MPFKEEKDGILKANSLEKLKQSCQVLKNHPELATGKGTWELCWYNFKQIIKCMEQSWLRL